MMNKMGAMLRSKREELKQEHGAAYDQGAVAARVGISQSVLSDLERGRLAYLPEPSTINGLARELDLDMVQLIQAAGYTLSRDQIEETVRHKILSQCDLGEVLALQYNLPAEQCMAIKLIVESLSKR